MNRIIYNINNPFYYWAIAVVVLLSSCKKENPSNVINGSNNIVYKTGYMNNYKFRPLAIGNTHVVVYDFDIYSDILGQVAKTALGGKTNGKADWINNIEIKNLQLKDELQVSISGSDLNFASDLLNTQLVYTYYPPDNSGKRIKVLASFMGYDSFYGKVKLSPVSENLETFFSLFPYGVLSLEFAFSKNSSDNQYANLNYSFPFHYDYSYTNMESK